MAHRYAVMNEVHNAFAETLGCHDLYALVERGHSYQQTIDVYAVLRSVCTHGISEHTTQAVTFLCTYYILRVQWRRLLCVRFRERFLCIVIVHLCFASAGRHIRDCTCLNDGTQLWAAIVFCIAKT